MNRCVARRTASLDRDTGERGVGIVRPVRSGEFDGDIDLPDVDPVKYQTPTEACAAAEGGGLMTVKLRYKLPEGDTSSP